MPQAAVPISRVAAPEIADAPVEAGAANRFADDRRRPTSRRRKGPAAALSTRSLFQGCEHGRGPPITERSGAESRRLAAPAGKSVLVSRTTLPRTSLRSKGARERARLPRRKPIGRCSRGQSCRPDQGASGGGGGLARPRGSAGCRGNARQHLHSLVAITAAWKVTKLGD